MKTGYFTGNVKEFSSLFSGPLVALMLGLLLWSVQACENDGATRGAFSRFHIDAVKAFKPIVAFEVWATCSMDEKNSNTDVKYRGDLSFRRLRFGAGGKPLDWLSYTFQLHADRLGEDPFASTKGSFGGLGVWNAMLSARLLKNSELLNVHAGYYWAAISREFNISPWAVGSFDKTWSNWYLRSFLTGKGNGIESGIGLGGMKNFEKFGVGYRIGTYDPQAYLSSGFASRLYTGRLMLTIGQPEQATYSFMLSGNQWAERTGITLGLGASSQANGALSDSLRFDRSYACGGDLLINFKGLRVDGEYFIMGRSAEALDDFNGTEWHVRCAYAIKAGTTFIEPCISYEGYTGEGSKKLFKHISEDYTFNAGVNWYLSKDKLKVALHYVSQDGDAAPNKGDIVGLGFQYWL